MLARAGFDRALRQLSRALAACFRAEPRLIDVIGDRGAFAIVAAGLTRQTEASVTLAAIQGFVVPNHLASARRARSLMGNLARTGAASRLALAADGRERPWGLGGWLRPALGSWLTAYIDALRDLEPSAGQETLRLAGLTLDDYLTRSVNAYPSSGRKLAAGFQELSIFLDHKGGHVVLLDLLSRADAPDTGGEVRSALSRKGLARGLGVSRAQVTSVLAEAERLDLLQRHATTMAIRLRPAAYRQARLWVAHELAWVLEAAPSP